MLERLLIFPDREFVKKDIVISHLLVMGWSIGKLQNVFAEVSGNTTFVVWSGYENTSAFRGNMQSSFWGVCFKTTQ